MDERKYVFNFKYRDIQQVQHLLRRCLQKEARQRLRDIGDAWIEIEEELAQPDKSKSMVASDSSRSREWLAWMAAIVLAAALVKLGALYFRQASPAEAPEIRVEISTPSTTEWPTDLATFEFARTKSIQGTEN